MGVIIDLILVAIVAFCGWRGWRGGLIRGVCGVVALIVSIFIANIVATAYSGEFTGMLRPFASGVVDTVVAEALGTYTGAGDDADEPGGDESPRFLQNVDSARDLTLYVLEKVGLTPTAAERATEGIAEESERITAGIAVRITDRLCSILAYVVVFLICFLLLAIIFAVIGNLINLVFAIPGLELADSIAGAVFGVAKALLIIFALTVLLRYIGVLTAEVVDKTALLRYIVNSNPVANMLGI